jgi:hypothetical protein
VPSYEDFVIARNPEPDSTLPYLLRVPLPGNPVILKARETWPRTAKVYCHRAEEWPADPDVVERVRVRSCERRGAAIDLVLDRGRENRSQLVVAHERYPFTFADRQVTVRRAALPAGDYGVVVAGELLASVERKTLEDLASSLTSGKLGFQLTDLAAVPRAAVVVEERYSSVFKLTHVRPAVVADGLAECQVRWPAVPIVFCETRKLAQEWTYRFLAAASRGIAEEGVGLDAVGALAPGGALPPVAPTAAEVRAWALLNGYAVSDRGRVPRAVTEAFVAARGSG